MVPSSPQEITGEGVELTINGLQAGGYIYLQEATEVENFLPIIDAQIPSDEESATKLAWDESQNAWISTSEQDVPYRLQKIGDNTYTLSRNAIVNFYAIVVAQEINGHINWVNAELTPRVNYTGIHTGFTRDEQSSDIINASVENNTVLQNTTFDVVSFKISLGNDHVSDASELTIEASTGIEAEVVNSQEQGYFILRVNPSTFDSSNCEISVYYNDMYVAWVNLWASD